jgi:hypothetical protein
MPSVLPAAHPMAFVVNPGSARKKVQRLDGAIEGWRGRKAQVRRADEMKLTYPDSHWYRRQRRGSRGRDHLVVWRFQFAPW